MIELKNLDLSKLKEQFEENNVIKYIILDHFVTGNYASLVAKEHKEVPQEYWLDYSHTNQIKTGVTDKSLMGKNTRLLIEELSSSIFLEWLSGLTGFKDLIVDPELDRAGLHKIKKNGYLNVHTDEQSHTKHKYWKRRLNLLLYLSSDYEKSWGGNLELWDHKSKRLIESISPEFNRCVIFATDNKSYHGHPSSLNCPENSARRSLALYYYQKTIKALPVTPTNYMSLPNDSKKKRFSIRLNVFFLYCFALLKRYTKLDDEFFKKISSYFTRRLEEKD